MSDRPNFEHLTDLALAGQSLQGTELHASIAAALSDAYAAGVRQGRAEMREAAIRAIEMAKIWDNMAIGRAAATLRVIRGLPDTPE